MVNIIIPDRFRQQPRHYHQLDPRNAYIQRGILLAFNGATGTDSVSSSWGTTAKSVDQTFDQNSVLEHYATNSNYRAFPAASDTGWLGPLTVISRFKLGAAAARLLSKATTDSPNNPLRISLDPTTNGVYVVRAGSTYWSYGPASPITVLNSTKELGIVIGGSMTQTPPTFYDGAMPIAGATVYSGGNVQVTGTNSPVQIGNWDTGGDISIEYLFVFPYAMSGAEVADVIANPWQVFKKPPLILRIPSASGANLAANATDAATASGTLTQSVPLAAAGVAIATASGALSQSIALAGAAQAQAAATGDVSTTSNANLAATATATASASGGLSLSVPLSASAVAQALASAELTHGDPLSAAASAAASASASMSISVSLSGAAIAAAAAAANLTDITSGLSGSAAAQASASGALALAIPLTASALTVASAAGGLTQIVPLASAAASASMATGGLDVTVNLSAAALAQALAAAGLNVVGGLSGAATDTATADGTLTLRVNLDGAALAQAIAAGALTAAGLIVAGTPGYTVSRAARSYQITRAARSWRISA